MRAADDEADKQGETSCNKSKAATRLERELRYGEMLAIRGHPDMQTSKDAPEILRGGLPLRSEPLRRYVLKAK